MNAPSRHLLPKTGCNGLALTGANENTNNVKEAHPIGKEVVDIAVFLEMYVLSLYSDRFLFAFPRCGNLAAHLSCFHSLPASVSRSGAYGLRVCGSGPSQPTVSAAAAAAVVTIVVVHK